MGYGVMGVYGVPCDDRKVIVEAIGVMGVSEAACDYRNGIAGWLGYGVG